MISGSLASVTRGTPVESAHQAKGSDERQRWPCCLSRLAVGHLIPIFLPNALASARVMPLLTDFSSWAMLLAFAFRTVELPAAMLFLERELLAAFAFKGNLISR